MTSKQIRLLLIAASFSAWGVFSGAVEPQPDVKPTSAEPKASPPEAKLSEEATVRHYLQTLDVGKETQYAVAFKDLNGDGVDEAIVYLMGGGWCGSGGCTTLVLKKEGDSWATVSRITITRPPIRVLTSVSKGWHDLGVWVQGEGTQPGYEAELVFDGKSYPRNPTTPPARPSGEVLIKERPGGKPINEDHAASAP